MLIIIKILIILTLLALKIIIILQINSLKLIIKFSINNSSNKILLGNHFKQNHKKLHMYKAAVIGIKENTQRKITLYYKKLKIFKMTIKRFAKYQICHLLNSTKTMFKKCIKMMKFIIINKNTVFLTHVLINQKIKKIKALI